ncbi:MAG: PocR ligand-binding domain-containing protein [candidate division Zixibacteria bacterium]|nr:PocR ligand-binding domain-containing protein [candidate division Zixibacteria bacterium]
MPGYHETTTAPSFAGIELEKLQQLQESFAAVTNLATIIIDVEGQTVTRPSNFSEVCRLVQRTEKGKEFCDRSDKERTDRASLTDEPVYHMCQCCGFLDGAVPIAIDNCRIGYWLIGQCNALGVSREDLALHAKIIGADVDAVLAAYDGMEPMSVARYEQILELLRQTVELVTARR